MGPRTGHFPSSAGGRTEEDDDLSTVSGLKADDDLMNPTRPARQPHNAGHTAMARARVSAVTRWLRWGLALVLVTLTVRLLADNPAPFREVAKVQASKLVTMILLMAFNQWLTSSRFQLVMKHCGNVSLSTVRWFQLTSVGQFLNLFVPQLGHVYRGVVLHRDAGLPYAAYTAGMFAFFWFELVVGVAFAVLVISSHNLRFHLAGVYVLPMLCLALVGLLAIPLLCKIIKNQAHRLGRIVMLETLCESLTRAYEALYTPIVITRFVLLNLAVVVEQVAILWLAFDTVGSPPDIGHLMLFQVLLKLSGLVMITPGNLGLTELAYGALAGASATGVEHGIAAALLMRTLGTIVLVTLGLGFGGAQVLIRQRRALKVEGSPPGA